MTFRRHMGRLSGVLVLGLVAGLARADGPEFRVGMKVLAKSPGLVLKEGDRSVRLRRPRGFIPSSGSRGTGSGCFTGRRRAWPRLRR